MATNFQKKTETQDKKATARPQTSSAYSSTKKTTTTSFSPKPKSHSEPPKSSLEKLDRATNSEGEVFQANDLIQVKDLKGRPTTAKLQYFFSVSHSTMAVYTPAEDLETGWEWERGCCLVDALVRA